MNAEGEFSHRGYPSKQVSATFQVVVSGSRQVCDSENPRQEFHPPPTHIVTRPVHSMTFFSTTRSSNASALLKDRNTSSFAEEGTISMPAAQDLMNNPLEFFRKNIVMIHGLNPVESNYGATTNFSLIESDDIFGQYTQGTRKSSILKKIKTAEIYRVEPYNNDPTTLITAYWCGYKDDSVKFQMLGNDPNTILMLTHRMDGCTFGVGSATPTGHVLVGHFNIQTVSGRADVQSMRESAKIMLGDNARLLEKTNYMKGNNSNITTTFGVRTNTRWKFYHQRYRPDGLSYKLVDVRPI